MYAPQVFKVLKKYYKGPVVAVFGNEDYESVENEMRRLCPDIIWLNDSYYDLELKGVKVRLIGTRGVIDVPTPWQMRNIPDIRRRYENRLNRIESLLRGSPYPTVLISHYAPTYATLHGEMRKIWRYLGSKKMEALIRKYKPTLVIHGHAHKGVIERTEIEGVPIFNVSLPAFERIFIIPLELRPTLMGYF